MLENTLSHVARQEQAIRLRGRQSGEEPQLRRRKILRLVDDDMVERLAWSPRQRVRQAGEDVRPGRVAFGRQRFAHRLEHRPQAGALIGAKPALASHPLDGRIGVERRQAPGVDDIGPLGQQESLGKTLEARRCGRGAQPLAQHGVGGDARAHAVFELIHLLGDALERRRGDAGDDAAGLGRQDQHLLRQASAASGCEKLASSTLAFGILAGEPDGAMDRHDGLAGARRTGDARRPREGTLDQRPLGRVEEDAPFLPWKGERLFQFLLIGDRPDPPQRIGMRERIGDGGSRRGRRQPAGGGIFEQGFGGFGRQMGRQREETVFAGRADVGQPVGGHADREQRIVVQRGKQRRRGARPSPCPWRARERRNRTSAAGRPPPHARAPRRSGRRRFADAPRSAGVPPRHRRRRGDRHRRRAGCRPSCGRSGGCRD